MNMDSLSRREYGLGNKKVTFQRENEKKLHVNMTFAPCRHSEHSSTINHFDISFSNELLVQFIDIAT